MSSSATTLSVIAKSIAVLNGVIDLHENAAAYRAAVAKSIAENRDLTVEELDEFRLGAADAIAKARED